MSNFGFEVNEMKERHPNPLERIVPLSHQSEQRSSYILSVALAVLSHENSRALFIPFWDNSLRRFLSPVNSRRRSLQLPDVSGIEIECSFSANLRH